MLFSGDVVVGPGKTRTLDIQPSPAPVRLSATFDAESPSSRVRLVLLTNGSALAMTPYGASGDLASMLEPNKAYRLVLDNRPADPASAKVALHVRVGPESPLPAATRTWLAAGSISVFLVLAAFSGVTLWRKTRSSPSPYS